MAAHVEGSTEPEYISTYLASVDGLQEERFRLRCDYIDKIDTDYIMQKRSRFGLNEGLEWKPEFFPKQMIIVNGRTLYGYNSQNDTWTLVNQVFKDCHDRIHAVGGNQFFPVEILNKDKSHYPGQFYFFVATTVRDAINNVMDGGYFNYIGDDRKSFHIKSMGRDKLAVFKDLIEGCASWVDPAYSGYGKDKFFSDAFLSELKNHDVEGFHCATTWQEL